jgi:hypothetical protein
MLRRLSLSLKRDAALTATRVSIGKQKLVYLLISDKRLRYGKSKSRIAYIGTTKRGVGRVAGSVASRADEILSRRGVRSHGKGMKERDEFQYFSKSAAAEIINELS